MLEGQLGDFSLPDIFQLIALTKKSGALRVSSDQKEGRVLFRGGEVCFAVSDVKRLAMGARLVASGLVEEDQIVKVLEAQKNGGSTSVLQALLEDAVVDEGALDTFVRAQIEDAIFELMRLEDASFVFDADDDADDDSPGALSVSTEHLIMEGGRRLGEWASIRDRIPSNDAVLELVPNVAGDDGMVSLPAEQWRVMALIDGNRTVREIVELYGHGEFSTSQLLCSMVSAGLVDVSDPSTGKSGALSKLVERRDLLRRLEEMELGATPSRPASVEVTPAEVKPAAPAAPVVEPATTVQRVVPPAPPAAPPAEPVVEQPKPEPAPAPEPASAPEPAPAPELSPSASAGNVDRSQMAREFASLGLGDATPPVAAANGSSGNGSSNGNGTDHANGSTPAQADAPRTLTRDEDVNKGLLLRLIDGVKGA